MKTRLALLALATVAFAGPGQNSTTVKVVPITATSPSSGQEMFATYCAACHGRSGKGDGPAAAALKVAPPDLTRMAARSGGKLNGNWMFMVLTGREEIAAHGSSEMPVWGDLFRSMNKGREDLVKLRVANLIDYIELIQGK